MLIPHLIAPNSSLNTTQCWLASEHFCHLAAEVRLGFGFDRDSAMNHSTGNAGSSSYLYLGPTRQNYSDKRMRVYDHHDHLGILPFSMLTCFFTTIVRLLKTPCILLSYRPSFEASLCYLYSRIQTIPPLPES